MVVSVDAEIPRSGTFNASVVVGDSGCVVETTVSSDVEGAGTWLVVVVNSVLVGVLLDEVVLVSETVVLVVVVASVVVVAGAVVVGAGVQVTVVETVFETPFTVAVAV